MTDRDVLLSVKAAIDAWLAQPVPAPPAPAAGINLAGVDPTSTEFPVTDVLKASRPFYSQRTDLTGPDAYEKGKELAFPGGVSPRGYPLGIAPNQFAETLVFEGQPGHYPTGPYWLHWFGSGVVQLAADGQVQDTLAAPGRAVLSKGDAGSVAVRIMRTVPGNPVRDLAMVASDAPSQPTFRTEFVRRWAGFGVVRFMDWLRVSTSKLAKWEDRPLMEDATYAGPNGVPIEGCLYAASAIGADPWLCVPMAADDRYVRQMAELVGTYLPAGRRCWIEYGNECWNAAYSDPAPNGRYTYGYCRDRGRGLGLAADEYTAALRFYAKRSAEIFALFSATLGPDRLVRVLAWHADNPARGQELLDYQGLGKSADAIAIAPYWGHGDQIDPDSFAISTMPVDAILDRCEGLIVRNRPNLLAYAKLAKERGLELVAYEGGQHLTAAPGQDPDLVAANFVAANRHPRMYDLYRKDLRQWVDAGGGTFCFFSSCSRYGRSGSWGLLEYDAQDENTAPKLTAAREAAA
jgi:hypothetical protein